MRSGPAHSILEAACKLSKPGGSLARCPCKTFQPGPWAPGAALLTSRPGPTARTSSALQAPDRLSGRCLYFVRTNTKGISDRSFEADMVVGEISGSALDTFKAMISDLYLPILSEQASTSSPAAAVAGHGCLGCIRASHSRPTRSCA